MTEWGKCPYLREECIKDNCLYYTATGGNFCSLQTCRNCIYENDYQCSLDPCIILTRNSWCRTEEFIEKPFGEYQEDKIVFKK